MFVLLTLLLSLEICNTACKLKSFISIPLGIEYWHGFAPCHSGSFMNAVTEHINTYDLQIFNVQSKTDKKCVPT